LVHSCFALAVAAGVEPALPAVRLDVGGKFDGKWHSAVPVS